MTTAPKNVLILCTGNSARSQMAEVLWNQLAAGAWQAQSAGSKPTGYVHPLALESLQAIGLPTDGLTSKHLDQFKDTKFDLIVTVCDNAKESCPVLPGSRQVLHWPFEDPATPQANDEAQRAKFRTVRDQIAARIAAFLRSA